MAVVFFYASLSMQLETARTVRVERSAQWSRVDLKAVSDVVWIMNWWLGLTAGEMFSVCVVLML
jgi:hypothetical protein